MGGNMYAALSRTIRRVAARRGGDSGFAIVLVALLLVFLMTIAAIVVDLANARQQNRDAVAAADAGALAGAQALGGGATIPGVCTTAGFADANCLAAYHTFGSVNIVPSSISRTSTCTLETVQAGDTCYHYTSGGTTVEVKSPYTLTGYTGSKLVRVKVCWDAATSFAQVIGTSSVNVCGAATAFNSGNPGSGGPGGVTTDCSVEDNFEDSGGNSLVYVFDNLNIGSTFNPANGNKTAQHDEVLAVVFDGHGTELDPSSIVFMAPTTASGPINPPNASGNVVQLNPVTPNSNNGPGASNAAGQAYVLETLDTTNTIRAYAPLTYPASAGNRTIIAYKLPSDGSLKPGGQNFVYNSTLHVNDIQNGAASPPTRCGNADWTFNHDGSFTSTCKENSFFGFAPYPPSNQISAGTTIVQSFYVDESPLENWDYASWPGSSGFPANPNFGIDFKYTLNGVTTRIPQYDNTIHPVGFIPNPDNGQYWLTTSDAQHSSDQFNTTINWRVPLTFANGSYNIYLKAYDTDHPGGGDCGVANWNVTVSGGTSGQVNLVE